MLDIHRLGNLFLYAGVEREEYDRLLGSIREENRVLLRMFSQLGALIFFVLFIVSMLSVGFFTINNTAYLVCGFEMLAILLVSIYVLPKRPSLAMVFVLLFEITLYVFGIHISMLHTEYPAVSAVAFLLVSPLLFYDRPVRLFGMNVAVIALFCAMVLHFKEPDVAQVDVWNMITFGIVALAVTMFIMGVKMRALAQSRQIEYLSQTDLLTGTKNRNHYESRLLSYPSMCASRLSCVYGDVNGLHEMNNKNGHQAGDAMLRTVAESLLQHFGPEHTYRIGGDEFVAFRVDGGSDDLLPEVEQIRQDLGKRGYNVSFGVSTRDKGANSALDVYEVVKEAEENMFADKRKFYSKATSDRRSR